MLTRYLVNSGIFIFFLWWIHFALSDSWWAQCYVVIYIINVVTFLVWLCYKYRVLSEFVDSKNDGKEKEEINAPLLNGNGIDAHRIMSEESGIGVSSMSAVQGSYIRKKKGSFIQMQEMNGVDGMIQSPSHQLHGSASNQLHGSAPSGYGQALGPRMGDMSFPHNNSEPMIYGQQFGAQFNGQHQYPQGPHQQLNLGRFHSEPINERQLQHIREMQMQQMHQMQQMQNMYDLGMKGGYSPPAVDQRQIQEYNDYQVLCSIEVVSFILI